MLESKRLPREMKTRNLLETKAEVEVHHLYAPPLLKWSKWYKTTPITVPAQVEVTAEPVLRNQNEFHIEVEYVNENSQRVIKDFSAFRRISFKAGNPNPLTPDAQVLGFRLRSSTTGQNIRVRVEWYRRS